MNTHTRRRRPLQLAAALPPHQGGKRRLVGWIARALPEPREAPRLLDPFLGGGSVSLWAKRRGYEVLANDLAERSVIVGRALIENDDVRLTSADLTRLFAAEPEETPGFVERVHGGEVLPTRHARFLDAALPVARSTPGAKGALYQLLLLRYVLALRPMGNFGAKTIVRQLDEGRWDEVNPAFLRDPLAARIEAHPWALCDDLRKRINRGVFSNGRRNEVRQEDALAFLEAAEGDVVYLDPPYGGTSAYETALRPLDSILAGEPVAASPSRFSGRGAIEALDELLHACRRVPHLVLSYGNTALAPDVLEELVGRHRKNVHMEVVAYSHLAGLASEESKARNREVIITTGEGRGK